MYPFIRTHSFFARSLRRLTTNLVIVGVIALALAFASAIASAQPKKSLGAYVGTINVSASEISPKVNYRATIKVNLPLTEKDGSTAQRTTFPMNRRWQLSLSRTTNFQTTINPPIPTANLRLGM